MKSIIILGSSRSNGNTKKVVDFVLNQNPDFGFIDLNELKLHYFNYDHSNLDDDFIPSIEKILQYDRIILASPVYWYAVSAIMKTFIDRITDLLKARHDLGIQLKGKTLGSISCSGHDDLDDSYWKPLALTADYLHMKYHAHIHVAYEDGLSDAMKARLSFFNK
ncbi:MAG: NAD(P)H-dependent oxidoreductase [Bacteroidota bacterium]